MVRLVLGIHNHQPVGNFDHVFEKAHQLAYGPFLNALERHPHVKVSLHCTGPLWEWLEARRPEYLERVEALARSGRVELMGGAFYEAVLAAVPEVANGSGGLRRFNPLRFGAARV